MSDQAYSNDGDAPDEQNASPSQPLVPAPPPPPLPSGALGSGHVLAAPYITAEQIALLRKHYSFDLQGAVDQVEKRVASHILDRVARDTADTLRFEHDARQLSSPAFLEAEMSDLLAEPDEEVIYRIDRLWPTGGNVMLSAQRKAGKSTMVGNLIRSLADGEPFLGFGGRFGGGFTCAALPEGERVALWDLELDRGMLRRWLRDQAVQRTEPVLIVPLRGKASELGLLDPQRRSIWASWLRERNVKVLIVDPLAPLLAAAGVEENDNTGIARMLNALDALKAEGEVSELLVVHHMGHNGERSRGASRLRDWPDVEWRLVREGAAREGEEPPPDAARFFLAEGRDVAVPEAQLEYDSATRRLQVKLDSPNRAGHRRQAVEQAVLAFVELNPGALATAIKAASGRAQDTVQALGRLEASGDLHVHDGQGRARHHYLASACTFNGCGDVF